MARKTTRTGPAKLPLFLSTALDRMRGCLLTVTSTRILFISRSRFTGSAWQRGETHAWNPGEPLLFIGTEQSWVCDDGARRRGHLMLMTPGGIGYLHPKDLGSVRLLSESDENAEAG